MGYSRWLCDHVRTIPADYRSDCDGRLSRHEEEFAIRVGYLARRHLYVRLPFVRHDRNRGCVAVPTGRRARTGSRPPWADPIRRIEPVLTWSRANYRALFEGAKKWQQLHLYRL